MKLVVNLMEIVRNHAYLLDCHELQKPHAGQLELPQK